ncbi:CPBP family intramembrane glutamic endopeptidase, partial [Staphylococcus pseudintermedius]|uniref:CPBP family intramembrane glutamic endopeptidase n=1 Tax=Staphylococcus pseudintermedius TaxID=283734 RepID=UPI0021B1EBF3
MIVIVIFLVLHCQHVVARIKKQLIGMRHHLLRIIIVYLLLVSFIFIYQRVIPPMTIQDDLITLPLSFVTIGILTPIVEELLFRYLIIGELGTKWGFRWMAVVSIIAFGAAHFLPFT